MDLANIAGLALLRGYGRENELEADRVGAEYMANLGYDPNNLLKVIGVLKNQQEFDKILAERRIENLTLTTAFSHILIMTKDSKVLFPP